MKLAIAAIGALCMFVCPLAAAEAAEPPGASARAAAARVWLQILRPHPLPPALLEAMMDETRAVWRQHGVDIRWSFDRPAPEQADLFVRVNIERASENSTEHVLGSIQFVNGEAMSTVRVSLSDVERLLATVAPAGRRMDEHPETARFIFLARALGRSLAHELGHYLLNSSQHSPRGLMRARFVGAELVHPSLRLFRLDRQRVVRVHERLQAAADARATQLARSRAGGATIARARETGPLPDAPSVSPFYR